jgi:dTDP-4-dehydrorhamnose 3,5-epimerase-like enzyme
MKKLISLFLMLLLTVTAVLFTGCGKEPYLIALTNQSKAYVEVYDITEGKIDESSLVWSYKLPYNNIAGVKFRHSKTHGDVVLAVCGNNYGCMVSYPEGEIVWSTVSAASNPHSIELMPNSVIAIASSDGNEIRFYTTDKQYNSKPAASVILDDAHGVLWDEENEVLWAVGGSVLAAYKVTLNEDNTVTVIEDTALRADIPGFFAHDLAPVYGNKDALWITTKGSVFMFNKTTKEFVTDYEGSEILDCDNVKGVGNFDDGSVVYIYPDGEYQSWTSKTVYFLKNGVEESISLVSEDGHFYKVRVWDTRYQ